MTWWHVPGSPCILDRMRRAWIVVLWIAAGQAEAQPMPHHAAADDAVDDFWRDVIEPHSVTVSAIVAKAKRAIGKASDAGDDGEAVEQRQRNVRNAYGMLRYARKLSPDNP